MVNAATHATHHILTGACSKWSHAGHGTSIQACRSLKALLAVRGGSIRAVLHEGQGVGVGVGPTHRVIQSHGLAVRAIHKPWVAYT